MDKYTRINMTNTSTISRGKSALKSWQCDRGFNATITLLNLAHLKIISLIYLMVSKYLSFNKISFKQYAILS